MNKIYWIGILWLGMLCIAGCSSDTELLPDNALSALTVRVEATDFCNSEPQTRIDKDDEGEYTFSEGDVIGIFGIQDGKVRSDCNNLAFEFDGTNWNSTSDTPVYHYVNTTYYAYYPYNESYQVESSIQEIVSAFEPATDQSTEEAYLQSDLLISTGSISNQQLVFQFTHAMSLLEVTFPTVTYNYTSGSGRAPYIVPLAEDVTFTSGNNPFEIEQNKFRLIVKPEWYNGFGGHFTQDGSVRYFTCSTYGLAAGQYKRVNINKSDTKTYNNFKKQQGDYFMKDGTIIPKDETLTDEQKANCIGIVFYPDSKLRFHSYEKHAILHENGQPGVHGYVVALKDAYVYDSNYNYNTNSYEKIYEYVYEKNQCDNELIPNSTTLKECDLNNGGLYYTLNMYQNTYYHRQAAEAVKTYNQDVPTPNTATQWFAPSVGQWMDMLRKISSDNIDIQEELANFISGHDPNGREIYALDKSSVSSSNAIVQKLNNKFSKLTSESSTLYDPFVSGYEYWSSLEYDSNYAWSVKLSYPDNSSGTVVDKNGVILVKNGKWNYARLRCMLAF
jgi:hypothetical protein